MGKENPSGYLLGRLRQYGIFTGGNLSLSEYVRVSCAMNAEIHIEKLGNRNDNAEENECDDKNAGDLFKMQFWKMPLYHDDWLEEFCMKLSDDEAQFLRNRL